MNSLYTTVAIELAPYLAYITKEMYPTHTLIGDETLLERRSMPP